MSILPTVQEALDELAPLIAALYVEFPRALRDSIQPYFNRDGRSLNEVTASVLFRDQILHRLKRRYYELTNDGNDFQFSVRELGLRGVEGTFGRWNFKIFRSRDGLIPSPNDSRRRAAFYSQNQLWLPGFADLLAGSLLGRYNIVILWDADAWYSQFFLRIALPLDEAGVSTHFNVAVTQPDQEDDDDLDVRLKPDDGGSADNVLPGEDQTGKVDGETDAGATS